MALSVGDPAPDFALPLKPGEAPLRLSDYQGEKPVVLLFFPLAFSPRCSDEFQAASEAYEDWKALGAEVIGVSADSPFVTQKFAAECGAPFPIVSDFNRSAINDFGVLNEDFFGLEGVAYRSAFVLDREGTVAYSWVSEDASKLPPFDQIREALDKVA